MNRRITLGIVLALVIGLLAAGCGGGVGVDGDTAEDGDTTTDGDTVVDGDTAVDGDTTVDGDNETGLCLTVACYEHAGCNPATGACDCDPDYQNWIDGVGCSPQTLEITGSYADGWGGHHEVTGRVWTQSGFGATSHFLISRFSNAGRVLVARNCPGNAYSPGLWSRFDWTWHEGGRTAGLWFCQTAYDAASEQDALAVPAADAADPVNGGCGGYPWSSLGAADPRLSIEGSWTDSFGGIHELLPGLWTQAGFGNPSFFHVTVFDNSLQLLVAANNVHNAYNAGLWSRFDWTWHDTGSGPGLWFCQTTYGAASEAEALALAAADGSDPAHTGCGGYAWSRLDPAQPGLILAGEWTDTWQTRHSITAATWTQSGMGIFNLSQFSNAGAWIVAQNHEDNAYNAGLWSRFDWTFHDAGSGLGLWYCQTAYDAASEADAMAVPAADATDPANGGCGGYAWSSLLPWSE